MPTQHEQMWDDNERKNFRHQFRIPMTEYQGYPTATDPLFPIVLLYEAWEYYSYKVMNSYPRTPYDFFNWLRYLEKDIPFSKQKKQP